MNRLNLIYHPTTHNATFSDTCIDSSSTDEENASGFFNNKAQRERFAEYHDFPISHSSKQDSESGYHYFGARYYDSKLLTGWLSVDPMVDKYPSINPYAYCAWTRPTGGNEHRWIKYNTVNNPVKLVDENGMEFGDFYNEQGKLIGSDGHTDGKKYLLKMVQLKPWEMDTEADNSDFGINKQERIDTEKIITDNDGNASAFTEDCIAYRNSIAIPTTATEFREMRELCKDQDHLVFTVEYGGLKCTDGNIYGGTDGTKPGIACGTLTSVQIKRDLGRSFRYWFHHHPTDYNIYQMPSQQDLICFPDLIGYTISFAGKKIYVSQSGRCQGFITFSGTQKF